MSHLPYDATCLPKRNRDLYSNVHNSFVCSNQRNGNTTNSINWWIDFKKLWYNLMAYTLSAVFWDWLPSPSFMLLRFIHIVSCICSFLFTVELSSIARVYSRLALHLSKGVWVVSSLGLVWIKLLLTFVHRLLWGPMSSSLLYKHLGLYDKRDWRYQIPSDCFPKWPYRFAFPPSVSENSVALRPCPALGTVSLRNNCIIVLRHCGFNSCSPND